jgi:RNA polymerase sigma-70 factor, ECF subfamily
MDQDDGPMDPEPIDATKAAETFDSGSDVDLVARVQAGDSSAETLLYERYGARIYYLALSRTGSPQDAEDLRSETLLRVLSAIRNHQVRSPAALARFILRTLDNVALEAVRRESQARRLAADPRANAERHFLDDRVKDAVEWTLARLKPRDRDFLRMYYYDELSKEEIARKIGIAEERVRLLKSRALKSFRERFLRGWRKDSDTTGGS